MTAGVGRHNNECLCDHRGSADREAGCKGRGSADGHSWRGRLRCRGAADWAAILDRAGVHPGAVDVVLEGADAGLIKDEPKPPDAIHFARSLPLDKAHDPEVLLAHRMNGDVLQPSHGFPLRAIVPGWYGVSSV